MKTAKASAETKRGLVVFASCRGGIDVWTISRPGKKGLRAVYFNEKYEGGGILLGSVMPMGMGYQRTSPDILTGRNMGIEFPARPEHERTLISSVITTIIHI